MAAAIHAMPANVGGDVLEWRDRVMTTPGQLRRVMVRYERELAAGLLGPEALAELWAWLAYLVIVRGRPADTTGGCYGEIVARYLRWCHSNGVDFRVATLEDLENWQRWLFMAKRNAAGWRQRQATAVRGFYDWRKVRGMGENCAHLLRTGNDKPKMPRKYSTEQLRALLAEIRRDDDEVGKLRDRAIVLMLLCTGARRAELCGLDLGDLELGKNTGVVRFFGKGAREREVSFEGPVVQALHEWLAARAELPFPLEGDAVFVTCRRGAAIKGFRIKPDAIESMIGKHAQAAGLRDWGVHRFRVTFATALYDAGAGIEEIRILLGHQDIGTTRRYLAVSEKARRTRLSAATQHVVLGTRSSGQPLWMRAALGGLQS